MKCSRLKKGRAIDPLLTYLVFWYFGSKQINGRFKIIIQKKEKTIKEMDLKNKEGGE